MLRPCIINLKGDKSQAIKGILWSSRGPWLIFRDCSGLQANQPPQPIDGEVHVLRSNVAFLQVLP